MNPNSLAALSAAGEGKGSGRDGLMSAGWAGRQGGREAGKLAGLAACSACRGVSSRRLVCRPPAAPPHLSGGAQSCPTCAGQSAGGAAWRSCFSTVREAGQVWCQRQVWQGCGGGLSGAAHHPPTHPPTGPLGARTHQKEYQMTGTVQFENTGACRWSAPSLLLAGRLRMVSSGYPYSSRCTRQQRWEWGAVPEGGSGGVWGRVSKHGIEAGDCRNGFALHCMACMAPLRWHAADGDGFGHRGNSMHMRTGIRGHRGGT